MQYQMRKRDGTRRTGYNEKAQEQIITIETKRERMKQSENDRDKTRRSKTTLLNDQKEQQRTRRNRERTDKIRRKGMKP